MGKVNKIFGMLVKVLDAKLHFDELSFIFNFSLLLYKINLIF